jgi:hypothetical protein
MDSLITAAARALAAGDPIGALKLVALRNDAAGLALRGTAMAQLGEWKRARGLLRKAARAFGPREAVSRARCVVAEAEVALVSRDLGWTTRTLQSARATLEAHGDQTNAALAGCLEIQRLLLIGELVAAERALSALPSRLPPPLAAKRELIVAGIAMRQVRARLARQALARAKDAAIRSQIPSLVAEVEAAYRQMDAPVARRVDRGKNTPLLLDDVETLFASRALIVDGCRNAVRSGARVIPLATRPVLMMLARVLAEAWPADVARDELVARTFRLRLADESHRARLRVEIGRLRRLLGGITGIVATARGFTLAPRAREVVVLVHPTDERHAAVLALLADGECWSTSALAMALATSQRTVQRALDELAEAGKVQAFGGGRARRWVTSPVPGFTTTLLLPASSPAD